MRDWGVSSLLQCCLITTVSLLYVVHGEVCTEAKRRCMSRQGCGHAMQNYILNCGSLIHGETNECSHDCKKALISLLSTQDQGGLNFMTCDCNNEQYCVTQKRRIEVCSQDVLREMERVKDENTPINCSLAELICVFDTTCKEALRFYSDYCRRMWRGEKCTSRCNNSLNILYRQSKAHKLKNCICDGSERYECQTIHDNTQRLCFKHKPSSRPPRGRDPPYAINKNITKPNITPGQPCHSQNASTDPSYHKSTFTLLLALLLWILSIL